MSKEQADTRRREPAGGVWGGWVVLFYAIFLLNCSAGGQGHHTGVRVVKGRWVEGQETGREEV